MEFSHPSSISLNHVSNLRGFSTCCCCLNKVPNISSCRGAGDAPRRAGVLTATDSPQKDNSFIFLRLRHVFLTQMHSNCVKDDVGPFVFSLKTVNFVNLKLFRVVISFKFNWLSLCIFMVCLLWGKVGIFTWPLYCFLLYSLFCLKQFQCLLACAEEIIKKRFGKKYVLERELVAVPV